MIYFIFYSIIITLIIIYYITNILNFYNCTYLQEFSEKQSFSKNSSFEKSLNFLENFKQDSTIDNLNYNIDKIKYGLNLLSKKDSESDYYFLNNNTDTNNNIDTNNLCCYISKKYINDPVEKAHFIYEYYQLNNCNKILADSSYLYNQNSNNELILNNSCDTIKNSKDILGSCRNTNKECVDFVNKQFCDKYNMKWSNKTCYDKL